MCENNEASFLVDFQELASKEHEIVYFLPEAPFEMLEIFDDVISFILWTYIYLSSTLYILSFSHTHSFRENKLRAHIVVFEIQKIHFLILSFPK